MIADFPSLKAELNSWLAGVSRTALRSSPFLGMMRRHIQHEGESFSYSTTDGNVRSMEYSLIQETLETTPEHIASMSRHDVLKLVLSVAESMTAQATRAAFETIEREIDAVGNTVTTTDPSSPAAFLAVLEKIQIDFDESRDKPQLPTVVCSPSRVAELRQRWDALTPDERTGHDRRREEILDRKFAEYVSRENNRILVD